MFEINLVPDIKAELLRKVRLRNLVIFISIIVAAGAIGAIAILGSVVTGQNIAMSNQDKEIACRLDGTSDKLSCSPSDGQAILKFKNVNEVLTIQDQMNKIAEINDNKMLLSRVFGLLDVILPTGDDSVEVSEMAIDLASTTITFDAQGNSVSNIDYRALEVFKNTVKLSYFDYGRYMRYDETVGNFVEIPTMCIDEVMENGVVYGVYHRGTPGCETSVLTLEQQGELGGEGTTPEGGETATPSEGENTEEPVPVEDVRIMRDYKNQEELDTYRETEQENGLRYYFESECMTYNDTGIDENATREKCMLSEAEPLIQDSSNGRDAAGNLVLRFSTAVVVNEEVFKFMNKHMRVIGPSRQNVTDSYTQIREMFTERARDCSPEDPDYEQCMEEVPSGS